MLKNKLNNSFTIFILIFNFIMPTFALFDSIYCGKENCYDILGVTRDSTKQEIAKAYRLLARKYHPDLHQGVEAKKVAEEQFKLIATAYEILKDEGSKADYDNMLDNPEEYYAHYYRYYRRRIAPQIDVRLVVIVSISIISIIQYYSGWQRYESAIKHFTTVPKYRNKAMEMAQDEISQRINKKGRNKLSKTEQKEELEKIIRKVIEDKMDIKGAYAKPSILDILWIQLIILPYTVLKYIAWYISWIWKFNILKRPYEEEQKLYLIRKNMGMGEHQFNALDESEIKHYLKLKLWEKEPFDEWHKEQEEEVKKSLAENPRYKSYRRYLKNHGIPRMTFEE
ncbi:dnaJ homolog subfamily C member 25 homolog [Condylostylus longicornis]|uniref:dnaJ homolog subfamily C member 25 homolog n=1 Tax=Condylostylus longicornis TaxID=2530218 RepID=UPI00244DE095|nr:dnaJ homolog subfamily C member 25 homolog [Condylostylus longicornis]